MKKMKLSNLVLLFTILLLVSFKSDKDKMHKRVFKVTVTDYKDGKPKAKTSDDEIEFKDGKLFSLYIFDKTGFEKIKYEIKIDSTYIEDEMTKEYIKIEATSKNDGNEDLYLSMIIDDFNAEGSVKLMKSGREKKYFEFIGKEKVHKKGH